MKDPLLLLRPRRKITGISAILLPYDENRTIDWAAFEAHVARTAEAGLIPAVNMDTGYVNLVDESERLAVLRRAREVLGNSSFVAGAFVADGPGDDFARDNYLREIEAITALGGTPVILQSHGLVGQAEAELVRSYEELGRACDRFIAFELGKMFAPFGAIYSLELFELLLGIKKCIGAKHSSLDRELEWQRLQIRDRARPEFHVFTGNDLAIDMVMYGSDYLLGLSTFAPDFFALRDRFWETGDPAFYELNDVLQYLGFLAFRNPVPAYKHSAAMFLKLRGWIGCDATHPNSPMRPESDRALLVEIGRMLGIWENAP